MLSCLVYISTACRHSHPGLLTVAASDDRSSTNCSSSGYYGNGISEMVYPRSCMHPTVDRQIFKLFRTVLLPEHRNRIVIVYEKSYKSGTSATVYCVCNRPGLPSSAVATSGRPTINDLRSFVPDIMYTASTGALFFVC